MTEEKVLHRKVLEAAEKSEAQEQQQKQRQLCRNSNSSRRELKIEGRRLEKSRKATSTTKYYGAVET